jgi:hypothetical protein
VKVINNFDSEFDKFIDYYDSQDIPPLIGISTTFYLGYSEVSRIVKRLRSHDKNMKIVIGGAFANEQTINLKIEDFEIAGKKMRKISQDATYSPRGLGGHLYWFAVSPFHVLIFPMMLTNLVRSANRKDYAESQLAQN